MEVVEGPIHTRGKSYRARAEARQRAYRADVLGVAHRDHGHWLSAEAAEDGSNFFLKEAFVAARERQLVGKGVDEKTFYIMLSSQAMCFNIFAPLATRLELATEVLKPFIPGLLEITAIHIEYTPDRDVFNDQSGPAGVDCDLLIEGRTTKGALIQVIETKFVEKEFSICGFRKSDRVKKGKEVCGEDVSIREDRNACLYQRKKGYAYWQRSDAHNILADDAVLDRGCPFGGARWQLWTNLTLAHEEASRRDAVDVRFAVCAPAQNTALLGNGEVLEGFKELLRNPEVVSLIDLEKLLTHLQSCVPTDLSEWAEALSSRYGGI